VNAYSECSDCIDYMAVRQRVVMPAMGRRMIDTGETARQILDRFMAGVHERHLAGLPILPPPRIGSRFAALMAAVHEAAQGATS
jgi:hypothetical protein